MKINLNNYKFIDLGCSKGGSLNFGSAIFKGKGLGVEMDPDKIKYLKKGKFNFINSNVLDLKNRVENKCDYATAIDFFEHLKNKSEYIKIMDFMSNLINKYIFIMQPYFENAKYLSDNELKYYWADWSGHPNLFKTSDFVDHFKSQNIYKNMVIGYRHGIKNLNDKVFVPLKTPRNSHEYDFNIHPQKKKFPNFIENNYKFYKQICVFYFIGEKYYDEIYDISKKLEIEIINF